MSPKFAKRTSIQIEIDERKALDWRRLFLQNAHWPTADRCLLLSALCSWRSFRLTQHQRKQTLLSPSTRHLLEQTVVHAVQLHHRLQQALGNTTAQRLAQGIHLGSQIVAKGGVDARGSDIGVAGGVFLNSGSDGSDRWLNSEAGGSGRVFGFDDNFGGDRKLEAVGP